MNTTTSVAVYFIGWTLVLAVSIASTEPPMVAALWAVVILCVGALAGLACAAWEKELD